MSGDPNRPAHWSTWDGSRITCHECGAGTAVSVQGPAWAAACQHAADLGDVTRCAWCEMPAEFCVGDVDGMYTGVGPYWPRPASGVSHFFGQGRWVSVPVCTDCLEASEAVATLRPRAPTA